VEPTTGINFTTWSAAPDSDGDGAFMFGMVLPADAMTTDATDYIGILVSRKFVTPQTLRENL